MPSSTPSVLGKYQILSELGQGGFATVYRAHDPELGRDVALKILDPLLTRDPVWSARFRREARAIASLDHARIVTIYEIGQAEGALFIAMKLVEGGNLAQRLAGSGALPWTEVVRLTSEIAEALDFAHGQGVLHRDLKPANVLLDPRTGAILTDFGLARMVADNSLSMSLTRGIVGTPAYVAPEVWEGKESSAQTDVYALGCIVYEMATGQPKFGGDTPPAVMLAHFQLPPLPQRWPKGVPDGLADVLATALARDPKARYARAGELTAALSALGQDPLAEPYQALLVATAAGEWRTALDLAGKIKTHDATYRDVVALERQALAAIDQAARREQAKQWQQTATAALAAGNIESARLAVRQWQLATPDDPALAAFLAQLQEVPPPPSPAAKQTPLDATGPASVLASPVVPLAAATGSNKPRSRGLLVAGGLAAIVLLAAAALMLRGGGKGELPSAAVPTSSVVTIPLLAIHTPNPNNTPLPATAALTDPSVPPTNSLMLPTSTLNSAKATATRRPALTSTPQPDSAVNSQTVNLRAGPGTAFDQLGSYRQETSLEILGKNPAGDWLKVRMPDGKSGWMAKNLLQVAQDLAYVPVVEVPALPITTVVADVVFVAAGEFALGSQGYGTEEQPQHLVYLSGFWIDRNEVSAAQYAQCVKAGKCARPGSGGNCTYGIASKLNHPINCVSWTDAQAYCHWLGMRLPTEAEWEKAARGNDGRVYPWGNNPPDGQLVNFAEASSGLDWANKSADDGHTFTAPTGTYPAGASSYGALDMVGNVGEWVADWYAADYYARSPRDNPKGADSGQFHAVRGGSWHTHPNDVRTAVRFYYIPEARNDDVGFRCARSS